MEVEGSSVLGEILESKHFGLALEGGRRSTKTWSILQYLFKYCQDHRNHGKEITISRDRLTWLKATVLKDFQEILRRLGWWNDNHYHGSDPLTYELYGNLFSFIGQDETAKLFGRKQHIFWVNELIGTPGSSYNTTRDAFREMEIGCTERWFVDYNPKVTEHWMYDIIQKRDDVKMIHSTQLHNPWLEEKVRKTILSFEPNPINISRGTADKVKWEIYGLGKRSQHEGLIFKNVSYCKEYPAEAKLLAYGLDFGYTNDVTALVKVGLMNGELWFNEIIYETGLLNTDIINIMTRSGVNKSERIVADSAEPKSIAEIKRLGWNIEPAQKGADSISIGIDILQRYKWNITERSTGVKQEVENYCWKEDKMTGKPLNVPIDDYNHAIDGIRYVALNCLNKSSIKAPRFHFS